VLYTGDNRSGYAVADCCAAAQRRGVVAGMPLAEAKGLLEAGAAQAALFAPYQPQEDVSALEKLALWCQRFSPTVGIEKPDSLLLDLTGCAHLFGGEEALARRLTRAVSRWNFIVRISVADTLGAAWAAAHYGEKSLTIIPPQQQKAAIALLPVVALRLSSSVIAQLQELDIASVEQLQKLPRVSLPARFGPEIAFRLDQATGRRVESISPVQPPEPITASREFEYPLSSRRALEITLGELAQQLIDEVRQRSVGVRRLEVRLLNEGKQHALWTIGLLTPSQSAEHLMELIRVQLEQQSLRQEVTGLCTEVTETGPMEVLQNHFFDAENDHDNRREFARLVDRLSNRCGKERVVRPQAQADAQPEHTLRWEPVLEAKPLAKAAETFGPNFVLGGAAWPAGSRPLHLRPEPAPIEVVAVIPEGPPVRFCWRNESYTVVHFWGPERIEVGWWRDHHVRRDYYKVETEQGERFWLFRRIRQGDWFLHGEFA